MKISWQCPSSHTRPFPGLPGFHTATLCVPGQHTLLLASPAKFPTCREAACCALHSHWLACVLISCNEIFLPTQSLKLVETINYFFFLKSSQITKAMSPKTLTLGKNQGWKLFLQLPGCCLPGAQSSRMYVPSSAPASAGKSSI